MRRKNAVGFVLHGKNYLRCLSFASIVALLSILPIHTAALADGMDSIPNAPLPHATPNERSDASFDSRLPPVLPGEEVNDDGNKMKVWSSAGGVPVSPAPEPFKKQDGRVDLSNGTTVILDGRPGGTD